MKLFEPCTQYFTCNNSTDRACDTISVEWVHEGGRGLTVVPTLVPLDAIPFPGKSSFRGKPTATAPSPWPVASRCPLSAPPCSRTGRPGNSRLSRVHLSATSRPPRGHLAATSRPPRGHLAATSRPPRGHLAATSRPPRGREAILQLNFQTTYKCSGSPRALCHSLVLASKCPIRARDLFNSQIFHAIFGSVESNFRGLYRTSTLYKLLPKNKRTFFF